MPPMALSNRRAITGNKACMDHQPKTYGPLAFSESELKTKNPKPVRWYLSFLKCLLFMMVLLTAGQGAWTKLTDAKRRKILS